MVGLVPPYNSDDDRSEGDDMTELYETEALIIRELEQQGPCTLDALAYRFPACTWNQIFIAVDALSREGTISLQPVSYTHLRGRDPSQDARGGAGDSNRAGDRTGR